MNSFAFQFFQEYGTVDNNGNASMAPSSPSSRAQARRTNAQIQQDNDQALIRVFKALQDNKFTLRTFLLAAFESKHEQIKSQVNIFYARGGPAAVLHEWGNALWSNQRYDESFTMEAIDIVTKRTEADLENAIKNASFRHPTNSISRKSIRKFSLDGIRSSLQNSAPYLMKLLSSLVPKKEGSISGWRPSYNAVSGEAIPNSLGSERVRPEGRTPRSNYDCDSGDSDDCLEGSSSDDSEGCSADSPQSGSDCDPQADSDWEEEKAEQVHIEDPRSFIATAGCMLLFMKSQKSNCFQMMMGIHLRGLSTPKKLIHLLSKLGLSMSYTSTTQCLKALARDNLKATRRAAATKPVIFLYDNINRKVTHRHQRKDKQDYFENATTGTIVIGKCLGEDIPVQLRTAPTIQDITINTEDSEYYRRVILSLLVDNIDCANNSPFQTAFNTPRLNALCPKRTKAYELAAMDIDQASIM
ncbi:hypothetical protein EMPS_04061 [Entomortierella parvispora]|uniref:Uncharacterized protein n=1 Tax=Entomortierella parvispora TaxID=205924 RepID=A0A9P3H7X1_9FUNG|nr:hypothetical protein EMPS_04061 [Entomortierella parvispora]